MVAYDCLCDQYAIFSFSYYVHVQGTLSTHQKPKYLCTYANNYVNVQHNQVDM